MLIYAINELRWRSEAGKEEVLAPGSVGSVPKGPYHDFIRLNAGRPASEDEVSLYKLRNPASAPARPVTPAPKPIPVVQPASESGDEEGAASEEGEGDAEPALTAKHKGGGRYTVVNAEGDPVSDDLFGSKDEAESWIENQKPDPNQTELGL